MKWLGTSLHGLCHVINRLALIAVLAGLLAYGGLSWLGAHPERLGGVLGLLLGQPVSVEAAQLSWRQGQPVMAVRQLTLYDPVSRAPALLLARADLALSWRWLLGGDAAHARLRLSGLQLRLLRDATGAWRVEGLAPADTDWAQLWEAWLGREARIQLDAAEVQIHDTSGQYLGPPVVHLDAELQQQGAGGHELLLTLRPGGEGRVRLQARWHGNPFAPVSAQIETYLQAHLPAALWAVLAQTHLQLTPTAGVVNFQGWLTSAGLRPQTLTAEIAAEGVVWREWPTASAWRLRAPQLLWQAGAPWRLELRDLVLVQDDQPVATVPQLRLAGTTAVPERLRITLDALRLGAVTALIQHAPGLPAKIRSYLHEAEPDGVLREVTLAYDHAEPSRWRLRGWGEGLTAAAWHELPGLAGLRGAFWAHEQGGQLHLDSPVLSVDLPQLFRAPLSGAVVGALTWWPDAGDWHLSASALELSNADLNARARFGLTLVRDAPSPLLDLTVTLTQGRAAAVPRYVPAHITNPKLVAWLDQADLRGEIVLGTVVLQGPLADFPFDVRPTGRFQASLQVRGAALTYQPRYPRLHELEANLDFDARSLTIQVVRGKTLEADLQGVHIHVARLSKEGALEVEGQATGDLATGLVFLRTTPLHERLGGYLGGVAAAGPFSLRLGLKMPFLDVDAITVDGRLQLQNTRLDWQGQPLEQIRGKLQFTTHGIEAQGIFAQFHDWPMELALTSAQGQTRINAKGPLTAARLRALADLPADWPGLAGAAEWRGLLTLTGQAGQIPKLEFSSTLQGLSLQMPEPLDKPTGIGRELRLTGELRTGAEWDLRYGDSLRVRFRTATERQAAVVALQWGAAPMPPRLPAQGVRMRGQLAALNLDAWAKLLPPAQSSASSLPALDVRVRIGQLRLAEQLFDGVNLSAGGGPGAVQVNLQSPDLSLEAQQPSAAALPWRVRIQRLHLHSAQPTAVPLASASPLRAQDWPAVELECVELRYDEHLLGKLLLAGKPGSEGWELHKFQLDQPRFVLQGEGRWLAASGWELLLRLHTGDMGALLREWGETQMLAAAEGQASLRLAAVPTPFAWQHWQGEATLKLSQGSLAEVEPGMGGRLLGFAGWQSIQRRLQLDFSDLFGKGMRFDDLTATATLGAGQMHLQPLRLEGPAARIEVSGAVGLLARNYALRVRVTPKATATLPLTGALTAGPAVGAALLVAQQLLGSEVDKLVRYEYAVTGGWDNPQVGVVQAAPPVETP